MVRREVFGPNPLSSDPGGHQEPEDRNARASKDPVILKKAIRSKWLVKVNSFFYTVLLLLGSEVNPINFS